MDDFGDDLLTAFPILSSGSLNGSIETFGDADFFEVTLTAGQKISIDVSPIGFDPLESIVVQIFNASQTIIDAEASLELNDPTNISFIAPTAGTYYIQVEGGLTLTPGQIATGGYNLNVLFDAAFTDVHGDNETIATPVIGDATFNAEIHNADDFDFFRLDLSAGDRVIASATTRFTGDPLEVVGVAVSDLSANVLAIDAVVNLGETATVDFTAPSTAAYIFAVTGSPSQTGLPLASGDYTVTFDFAGGPNDADFMPTITSFTAPVNAQPGQISFDIENLGSEASFVGYRILLVPAGSGPEPTFNLGNDFFDDFAAGDRRSFTVDFVLPSGLQFGDYDILVDLSFNEDANQGNNVARSSSFTVSNESYADLQIVSISAPDTSTEGPVDVFVELTNTGGADAGEFVLTVADGRGNFTDVTVPGLAAGATETFTVSYTIVPRFQNGVPQAMSLSAIVDQPSQVPELDDRNNNDSIIITPSLVSQTGTNSAETLTGTSSDDTLDALAGDDRVNGLDGDDLIYGGEGKDSLGGAAGNDTIFGGARDDTIRAGEGDDVVDGGTFSDLIFGDGGNDTIFGGQGNDVLLGRIGDDLIYGGTNRDNIVGEDGNDTLFGGADFDTVNGGNGADVLYGGDFPDQMRGGADNDTLFGDGSNDLMFGDSGNDTLFGGIGQDNMLGGDGDDTLDGGDDRDKLAGGIGNDTLFGGQGADRISGEAGDDMIVGGTENDLIFGGDGNDSVDAGAGRDVVLGKDGDDTLSGGGDGDKLYGEDGLDVLNGGDGIDFLFGGSDADEVYGGNDRDIIRTGSGQDMAFGGAGNDNIRGEGEDDMLAGDAGNDFLLGEGGNDMLDGGTGNDRVDGGLGNDTIFGASGNDSLMGSIGNDTLFGGANDDLVRGGAGNDTLDGGFGNDTLIGEAGDDVFVFLPGSGTDTVLGFGDGDLLQIFTVDIAMPTPAVITQLSGNQWQVQAEGSTILIRTDPGESIDQSDIQFADFNPLI